MEKRSPAKIIEMIEARLAAAATDASNHGASTAALAGPNAALTFDGDGTLWSGDVGEDFFHALVAHGDTRREATEALLADATEFGVRVPEGETSGACIASLLYTAYVEGRYPEERTCEMMTWLSAGWKKSDVVAFAESVVARTAVSTRIHDEVRVVLDWARRAGHAVVLVSASPREIVEAAGKLLDFSPRDVVAATAIYDEREVMRADVHRPIPYGPGKVTRLRERLGNVPLLAAFGDNAFDVPMLCEASVAVAVRPKDRLRARAAEVPGLVEIDSST